MPDVQLCAHHDGYRESEMITMCNAVHPNIVVPFKIYECTAYYDKNRPSWQQMEKLAIHVVSGQIEAGWIQGRALASERLRSRVVDDEASD